MYVTTVIFSLPLMSDVDIFISKDLPELTDRS